MFKENASIAADIERDPTHLAAADWFVRLQSTDVSIEDTLAWQDWLNAAPANAHAFARIEEISQALRGLPAPASVSAQQLARDAYDGSVALKDWRKPRMRARRYAPMAVAASIAIVAVTFTLWRAPAETLTMTTAIGENRSVALNDGSTISMGGDTRIVVDMSERVRGIELIKGEALFQVAKDAFRPFKVRAGNATIVAVGTAFNVERDSDRAVVSVTEGRVAVEPITLFLPVAVLHEFKPKLRTVHLDAGQQTIAGSAGIEEPTKMQDPATGWQIGRLAFHLQPLRYVLEDVNRYSHKPIVLESGASGALVVTGTVERENIAGWIKSLERAFDLQATEEPDQIVLRTR
jgi:transmembrane sensor